MRQDIRAIFFDLGDTLRILEMDEAHTSLARRRIVELIGTDEDPETFCAKLDERYAAYRKWALDNLAEASEPELWTRWLVPEFPVEKIAPVCRELTYQYRRSRGRRVVVKRGREVVAELYRRGYLLGIISNVISTQETPDWLEAVGLAAYFKPVVLSSVFGRRKPDPAIFCEAARLAGVDPACCAYVGDNPERDVAGARRAGFRMIILVMPSEKLEGASLSEENQPDLIIHEIHQLLDCFPEGLSENLYLRP